MSDLRSHVLAQLELAYAAFKAHALKATSRTSSNYIEVCMNDYRHSDFPQSLEDGLSVHAYITARTLKAHRVAFAPYVAPVAQPAQQAQADASTFVPLADAVAPVVARLTMAMPVQQAQGRAPMPADAHLVPWVRASMGRLGVSLWDWSDDEVLGFYYRALDGKSSLWVRTQPTPAMVPQPVQQPQAQDTRAASPILQRLAEAQAVLADVEAGKVKPGANRLSPRSNWSIAFDECERLKAMAVACDPVAYVRAYPSHAFAYRHLLPLDMVARIEAAETDDAMREAVNYPHIQE